MPDQLFWLFVWPLLHHITFMFCVVLILASPQHKNTTKEEGGKTSFWRQALDSHNSICSTYKSIHAINLLTGGQNPHVKQLFCRPAWCQALTSTRSPVLPFETWGAKLPRVCKNLSCICFLIFVCFFYRQWEAGLYRLPPPFLFHPPQLPPNITTIFIPLTAVPRG